MEKKEPIDRFKILPEDEKTLWEKADFVFDTSALINFYDYPEETLNDIFKVRLEGLKGRLWLPAHVDFEYLDERKASIKRPEQTYKKLKTDYVDLIEKKIESFLNDIKLKKKHPYFENELLLDFQKKFYEFKEKIEQVIDKKIDVVNKSESNDIIFKNIIKLFRKGPPYGFNKYMEIVEEGEMRYRNEIPPGYKDFGSKSGFQKYGDLVIWKQILGYAKGQKKSIVFITDDLKEDWWILNKSRDNIRPRDELRLEFIEETEQNFYMYTFAEFLTVANDLLDKKTSDETLEVVKETTVTPTKIASNKIVRNWIIENYPEYYEISEFAKRNDSFIRFLVVDGSGEKIGIDVKYFNELRNVRLILKLSFSSLIKRYNQEYEKLKILLIGSSEDLIKQIRETFYSEIFEKDRIKLEKIGVQLSFLYTDGIELKRLKKILIRKKSN